MLGLPPAAPTPAETLADWARAEFWQLQIPLMILPAPGGVGVEALSDFGERIHFPDQTAIQFFLLGYRLGESHALDPQQASPFEAPTVPDQVPLDEEG